MQVDGRSTLTKGFLQRNRSSDGKSHFSKDQSLASNGGDGIDHNVKHRHFSSSQEVQQQFPITFVLLLPRGDCKKEPRFVILHVNAISSTV